MSAKPPKTDANATLQELKDAFAGFLNERGWGQHHTPKNLAMSIAIEAAELMEHFQWGDYHEQDRPEIEAELADVLTYCLSFANALDIDITAAFYAKLERTRRKYPAAVFKPGEDNHQAYSHIKRAYRKGKTA